MATYTRDGLRRIRISESKISAGYTDRRKTKGKSRNLIRRAVMRQTNERLVLHRNRIFPIAEERKRENVFRVVYAHGRVLKRQETPSSPTRGKGSVRRVCSKGRKKKNEGKKVITFVSRGLHARCLSRTDFRPIPYTRNYQLYLSRSFSLSVPLSAGCSLSPSWLRWKQCRWKVIVAHPACRHHACLSPCPF